MADYSGKSKAEGAQGWARRVLATYPELVPIGAYALVAIAATITAYFSIFTVFASYDDEGTLLVTLRAFVDGDALYRDIWSVYGPFYYELFGGFFSVTGLEVSTDASRTIVIVLWVGTSLLFGLAAHRLTRNLWIGLTTMIAAFGSLAILVNEPMHPHGLCVLLLGAFTLLAVAAPAKRALWLGGGGGALLAALALTKVNLGAFAIAAVVLAVALTVWPLARRAWIRWLVMAAVLALPLFVMARDLDLGWTRELILLEVLAMAAILVAAQPLRPTAPDRDLWRWVLGALAGFVLALVAILAILLATGPSLADAYDGIVRQAMGIRDLLMIETPFPPGSAIAWAVGALAAAVLAARAMTTAGAKPALWSALLRALAGLAIWLAIAHIVVIGLNPSSANPVIVPMLVAWVAVIAPPGVAESPHKRFLRVLLPALAVAETLQLYPVAGSQLGIASVSFVTVGAICLADALTELKAFYAARERGGQLGSGEVATVLSAAVAAIFAINVLVLPAASHVVLYRDQEKLPLHGAGLMRLPADTVGQYVGLADLLRENHCTTFVGWPSFNSLYLWTDLPSPAPQPPNGWFYGLDDDQQQQAVDALRASPRPCAIRNEGVAANYLKQLPPPDRPLVRYVEDNFKPVAEVGEFEFLLPKPSATAG